MVHALRAVFVVAVSALGFAMMPTAPASADEAGYLQLLQPKYVFLSPQQLLDEGYKVCNNIHNGMTSPDAANMVQKEMSVSLSMAVDLVGAAAVQLGC